MSMATLYQIGEDGCKGERWELSDEPFVVGRSRLVGVSIEDEGVSRRHFLIAREGEDYVIKDLNSRNGTWVDGCRISAEKLHHNDRILAGRTQFVFAHQPALTAMAGKPVTGPHGTQITYGPREPEYSLSASGAWPEDCREPGLEAVA
jgi:pSer/pThr/pTyr-binding forkhead associated (FHA) protein